MANWKMLLNEVAAATGQLAEMEDGFAREAAALLHAGLSVLYQKDAVRAYDSIANALCCLSRLADEHWDKLPGDLCELFSEMQCVVGCWDTNTNFLMDDEPVVKWLAEQTEKIAQAEAA